MCLLISKIYEYQFIYNILIQGVPGVRAFNIQGVPVMRVGMCWHDTHPHYKEKNQKKKRIYILWISYIFDTHI